MDSQGQQEKSPSLEDFLKLLKGERDEQRLAGLLLVTKFCKGDDIIALKKIYDAVGVRFLERLLRTGLGKGVVGGNSGSNRDAYLQLSITVLAAFCRVPEIASSEEMISKIPLVLEVMSSESGPAALEECYEFLYLVSTASEDGATSLLESRGMKVIASQMPALPDGSHVMGLSMKMAQLLLIRLSQDPSTKDYRSELSMLVVAVSRQFAVLHNALKFEALHLLSAVFSSNYSVFLHDQLRVWTDNSWSSYLRVGIMAILQNRVAPAEKLHALILAESMTSIMGEGWLIGQTKLSDVEGSIPADRCLLLILESSRVEVAVLLNELAYLRYEASSNSSSVDTILLKQRNVAIAFSLVEKVIKLASNADEDEGHLIDEATYLKVIKTLNETIDVVLEYLQDAKEHGHKKGNDLLASVRVVGSYLAEAPIACEAKVTRLLEYMLSVEGEDESSPYLSVCFLLPMLCQVTMKIEGCKVLAASGGYKAVVECLIKLVGPSDYKVDDNGRILLACDTVLNLLLKKEQVRFSSGESTFIDLLKALVYWTESTNDPSITMMAGSICALIFDFTSEHALLRYPSFDSSLLTSLSRLIAKSLSAWGQDTSYDAKSDTDLLEIVTEGYSRWADRYPQVKNAVEKQIKE